jgi:hypothetical protein
MQSKDIRLIESWRMKEFELTFPAKRLILKLANIDDLWEACLKLEGQVIPELNLSHNRDNIEKISVLNCCFYAPEISKEDKTIIIFEGIFEDMCVIFKGERKDE